MDEVEGVDMFVACVAFVGDVVQIAQGVNGVILGCGAPLSCADLGFLTKWGEVHAGDGLAVLVGDGIDRA